MKISLDIDNFTDGKEVIDVEKYHMHGDYIFIYHPIKEIYASFRLLDNNLIDVLGNVVGEILNDS